MHCGAEASAARLTQIDQRNGRFYHKVTPVPAAVVMLDPHTAWSRWSPARLCKSGPLFMSSRTFVVVGTLVAAVCDSLGCVAVAAAVHALLRLLILSYWRTALATLQACCGPRPEPAAEDKDYTFALDRFIHRLRVHGDQDAGQHHRGKETRRD